MLTKMIGAAVGRRIAGRNSGLKGMVIGAAAPWLVRRAFTPFGMVAMGLYGAKKYRDWKREHDAGPGGAVPGEDYQPGGKRRR
ncbi:MAG: hypothetical protein ACK4K7_08965 [Allosphingosinicella sp.]|uniref:hypothetical protein n=1 Tax=Allosphingosinicella sp. TaxID=2823234 RepID=UPI003948EEBC